MERIISAEHAAKVDFIMNHPAAKISELQRKDIQNLGAKWSYYSGRIEGNTYTLVEVHTLLFDGYTSSKKLEDAHMTINLYNTFIQCVEKIGSGENLSINSHTVKMLHGMLTKGLMETEYVGSLRTRNVRIGGTDYIPPEPHFIPDKFHAILENQNQYTNPLEKAIYIHCNMARLQPFADGNKRTSRMLESVVLMNHDIIPTFTVTDTGIGEYKTGLLSFYETEDYTAYVDYFLNQQIHRINQSATSSESTFDLKNNIVKEPTNSDLPSMPDLSKTSGMTM